jgi:cobalt-zinc-cadmium efflux system protein
LHGSHHHAGATLGSAAGRHKARLAWALVLTLTYMTAEVIGGLITSSLALLADAAHMLTDAGGLALALLAIYFAERPSTPQKTYGYFRTEILSALLNAVVLLFVTAYILWEAYRRFISPPEILTIPMLAVALVGLIVNLISMRLLAGGSSESLNVQGAYFEVLSDMLGSFGVIIAALVTMWTGWMLADPLIAAGIGLFIVPRTWRLLSKAVHVLMEGVPTNIDIDRVNQELRGIPGVTAVHDLHVWTITSGVNSMTGHVVIADMADAPRVLRAAREAMKIKFSLDHVTIQVEDETLRAEEANLPI